MTIKKLSTASVAGSNKGAVSAFTNIIYLALNILHIYQAPFDNKKSIFSQFNNKTMQDLRVKHLEGKLEGSICKGCLLNKKYEYEKLTDVKVEENKPNLKKANSLKDRILKATNETTN